MTSIKRVVEAVGRLWKKFFLTTIKVAVLLKNDCLCPLLSKEKAPYQVLYEERPFVHGSLSIISLPKRRTVVENKLDCFNRKKKYGTQFMVVQKMEFPKATWKPFSHQSEKLRARKPHLKYILGKIYAHVESI